MVRRLYFALAAGALSLVLTTVQGLRRDGYDSWQQAVSALSLGPLGWIQMINLILFGVIVLTTVPIWRKLLAGGRGELSYPICTSLIGISFVVVGFVRQDPAPGYDPAGLALRSPTVTGLTHLAFAGVAALSSVVCLLIMANRFRGDPAWYRWPGYSGGIAAAVIACVTVYALWSVRASGYAGLFERGAIVLPMLWLWAFLRRLSDGAPFMLVTRQ